MNCRQDYSALLFVVSFTKAKFTDPSCVGMTGQSLYDRKISKIHRDKKATHLACHADAESIYAYRCMKKRLTVLLIAQSILSIVHKSFVSRNEKSAALR